MELVIKIPDEYYEIIKEIPVEQCTADMLIVKNGSPLPKGHGRLIDADAFKKNVCTYQQTGCGDCKHSLCCPEDAPTIIEADKAESEE